MSISYGDKTITTLSCLVAAIERHFTTAPPSEQLRATWAEIVGILALGPAPELRTCPTCGEIGMRAATRCIRCWSSLAPLPDEPRARVVDDRAAANVSGPDDGSPA